jgi:hypothetical protein
MAKLLDPHHDPEKTYMVRLSHAIAEHRGVAAGLCLLMLIWCGLGGWALQEDYSGVTSARISWRLTSMDLVFWIACAGALITLVGGWSFFHREMAAAEKDANMEPGVAEEIQKFKQESSQSKREERLKRLKQSGPKPGTGTGTGL